MGREVLEVEIMAPFVLILLLFLALPKSLHERLYSVIVVSAAERKNRRGAKR
jgi:hypothetical protein